MMNRLIVTVVFALFFFTTSAHAANQRPYLSGNLGVSIASDSDLSIFGIEFGTISFDPGFNIGGAIGYDFGNIRAEGEIGYHFWDMDTATLTGVVPGCPCTGSINGDASALSFMGNGYFDFPVGNSSVEPYLGAGAGLANITVGFDGFSDESDLVFAYQIMVGIGFEISPTATLTAGYRYFATTDPDFDGVEATVSSHDFSLGARFAF